MNRPEALLLDLDDTLLDWSGLSHAVSVASEAVARERPELDAERIRAVNGQVWDQAWPEFGWEWTIGRMSGAELTREVWRRTLALCDSENPDLIETAAATLSRVYRASFRLHPDAQVLLDVASGADMPMAIITNGASDSQREKLDALGIAGLFGSIVISGELGVAKPDIEPFRIASTELGVDPSRSWFVGDSLEADVAGGNAAGMTSVWINREGTVRRSDAPAPMLEVHSLEEIAALL